MADNQRQASPPVRQVNTVKNRGWCTVQQLAVLLSVDYRTARKWLADGRVKHVRVGHQIRIFDDEIRYILENGTRPPGTVPSTNPNKLKRQQQNTTPNSEEPA